MGATANYKWTLPTVHSDASTWGGELNTTIGSIDAVVWNIEKVELAAIQGQVQLSNLSLWRTASVAGTVTFLNNVASAGQQTRWVVGETAETESGGDAGSNLIIQSFTDAGSLKNTIAEFVRNTSAAVFNYGVTVQGAFSAASTVSVAGALNASGLVTATAGANFTGQVAVNGNILGNNHYFGWPGISDFLVSTGTNIRFLQWAANWYDAWNSTNGLRTWAGGGTNLMTLDAAGNLTLAGGLSAINLSTPGSVSANGNVIATGTVQANGGLVATKASGSGNANFSMEDNGGTARGFCYWAPSSNAVALLNLATNNSYQLMPGGDCYATPGTAANNFVVTQGTGLKPGGGSWGSFSDARIKTVRGDYASGLEAILELRPVTYVYKGEYAAGGKQFVGLVADEAMKVLPEMVSLQKGTIDGREVNDLKVLDTTPLIFALVNAIKELKAEIEALKAK